MAKRGFFVSLVVVGLINTGALASVVPIAHYTLDLDGTDAVNGYNAMLLGSAYIGGDGISGNCLHLVGQGGHAMTANTDVFKLRNETISLWFCGSLANQTGADSLYDLVDYDHDSYTNMVIQGEFDQWSNITYFACDGSALPRGAGVSPSNYLLDNQWHHLVAICGIDGGGGRKLYMDGVLVGQHMGVAPPIYKPEAVPFSIGSHAYIGRTFIGMIDDVQVYDVALSVEEVVYLYDHPGLAVPEPATLCVLALGGLAFLRRRRSQC